MAGSDPSRSGSSEPAWVAVLVAIALVAPVLASAVPLLGGLSSHCRAWAGSPSTARSPVQHVFLLIKENHAFENYFGALPGTLGYPPNGSFPTSYGGNTTVSPFPLRGTSTPDLPHDRGSDVADLDGGRNDLFVAQAAAVGNPAAVDSVGYYTSEQIPDYYAYARNYTLGDAFFSGVLGPTLPNRYFDLGLTDVTWTTNSVPPASAVAGSTILNQLESAQLPWNYFWLGPSDRYLAPMLVPGVAGDPCMVGRILPMDRFAETLNGPSAPSVAFIDPSPDTLYSEHPPQNVTLGEEWTVSVINEIFRSPIGPSSAVFLFYDENGGYWDPRTPPTTGPIGDGFRVPLIGISPWTPAGRISHSILDPAAILKFVDKNWRLPYLTPSIARAGSLDGFFNFSLPPRPPLFLTSAVPLAPANGSATPGPDSARTPFSGAAGGVAAAAPRWAGAELGAGRSWCGTARGSRPYTSGRRPNVMRKWSPRSRKGQRRPTAASHRASRAKWRPNFSAYWTRSEGGRNAGTPSTRSTENHGAKSRRNSPVE